MKLEDWMKSQDLSRWGDYEGCGYHVIRTCGECSKEEDCGFLRSLYVDGGWSEEELKTFGCIHFEQKEGS